MNNLRSSVRPVITYILVITLAVAFLYYVWNYSSAELAERVINTFLTLAVAAVSFWIGSRSSKSNNST